VKKMATKQTQAPEIAATRSQIGAPERTALAPTRGIANSIK
jgi:hypothetical protein